MVDIFGGFGRNHPSHLRVGRILGFGRLNDETAMHLGEQAPLSFKDEGVVYEFIRNSIAAISTNGLQFSQEFGLDLRRPNLGL